MAGKRVLFFGVTGVDKTGGEDIKDWGAIRRLARWVEDHRGRSPRPKVVDFEAEYLFNPEKGGIASFSFLNDEQYKQREVWRRAWAQFDAEILSDSNLEQDLYVSMHACIVRGHYGVRSVIDPVKVAQRVRPNLIVTLLDDVYDMWWRTEARAGGVAWVGRPTIEQLVFARRAELIMADQVAFSDEQPIANLVISVAHPCETLANRIYAPNPMVVYLCFPISAPRRLDREANAASEGSGHKDIMSFLATAYERQHGNRDLVVVCPLGIDELPLVEAMKDESTHVEQDGGGFGAGCTKYVRFDRDTRRWPLNEVWPADECLSIGPPAAGDRKAIPLEQLEKAAGVLHSDVGWRDYRLIEQARDGCLAAFNPRFKGQDRVSRSVREEIRFAAGICPVFVYQNEDYDPEGLFEQEYPQGGTMSPGPDADMVGSRKTVEAVFDSIEEYSRRRSR